MNMVADLLQQPLIIALGWTLLHFLWQGAALAAIYAVLMLTMRSAAPDTRYRTALGCLILLALTPAATFVYFASATSQAAAQHGLSGSLLAIAPAHAPASWQEAVNRGLQPWLPWLVLAWFAGVCFASTRMLSGWRRVRELRRNVDSALTGPWQPALAALKRRLRISAPVQLACSALIRIPMVIGWLKPIILIPPCVLAGLDSRQIEMILAHELAHIRRHDYLINLLQAVVETLLFYHPAVRWVSHQVRLEREKCCDRLVVGLSGDAIGYARALTSLEAIRGAELGWGLGASGGALYDRVQTLVDPRGRAANGNVAVILIALAALFGAANLLRTSPPPSAAAPASIERLLPVVTAPPIRPPVHAPATAPRQTAPRQPAVTRPEPSHHEAKAAPAAIPQPHKTVNPTARPNPAHTDSDRRPSASASAAHVDQPVAHRPAPATRTISKPKPSPAQADSATAPMPAKQYPATATAKQAPAPPPDAAQTGGKAPGVPIEMPMPDYPPRALMDGRGATVVVAAHVNGSGTVTATSLVGTTDASFARAALTAVRQWRFPAGAARELQFRFVFSTNLDSSNCQTVTGTHICGTAADLGDEIKGSIGVYAG